MVDAKFFITTRFNRLTWSSLVQNLKEHKVVATSQWCVSVVYVTTTLKNNILRCPGTLVHKSKDATSSKQNLEFYINEAWLIDYYLACHRGISDLDWSVAIERSIRTTVAAQFWVILKLFWFGLQLIPLEHFKNKLD